MSTYSCISEKSQLVVIDMQARLLNAMAEDERSNVLAACETLVKSAGLLEVPVIVSEQYPAGLGHTDSAIANLLHEVDVIEKTCFSCNSSEKFKQQADKENREQVVLCGIEAHVCVLQTALEMIESGKTVFVVEDAVCSRNRSNKQNALARIQLAGGIVTNVESVLFEWLRDAAHPQFKAVSALIR